MKEFELDSARQIDRLADGELSLTERRELLMALDREGDGWRRLALAFLESQALRDSLRHRSTLVAEPQTRRSQEPTIAHAPVQPARERWIRATAVVACCALMFVIGRASSPVARDVAINPTKSAPATYQPSDSPIEDANSSPIQIADTGSPVQQQTLRLELGDGQGGPPQSVEVPMVESSSVDPADLLKSPSVIPESIMRALLRSGRRVYEQRQLYEVTLEDGRHGVVPVSDVMVENAGWDVFQ